MNVYARAEVIRVYAQLSHISKATWWVRTMKAVAVTETEITGRRTGAPYTTNAYFNINGVSGCLLSEHEPQFRIPQIKSFALHAKPAQRSAHSSALKMVCKLCCILLKHVKKKLLSSLLVGSQRLGSTGETTQQESTALAQPWVTSPPTHQLLALPQGNGWSELGTARKGRANILTLQCHENCSWGGFGPTAGVCA